MARDYQCSYKSNISARAAAGTVAVSVLSMLSTAYPDSVRTTNACTMAGVAANNACSLASGNRAARRLMASSNMLVLLRRVRFGEV